MLSRHYLSVNLSLAPTESIWPVMSRFARLQSGPTRTWAPPESPFRVEFSPALLREVRMAGTLIDSFGILYGVRHGDTLRLVSTHGRAGLDPIGIFAARTRGSVFLTEQDLERFEKADACVALVISGETGGFFVRDAKGAIESLTSYQEFSLQGAPLEAPITALMAPERRRLPWAYGLALLPLLLLLNRHPAPALAVRLQEDAGQLRISWNIPKNELMMILDGGDLTTIPVTPGQSILTYARRTGDVVVKMGSAEARFVGPPLPPTEADRIRASIDSIQSQIAELRANKEAGQIRIADLQRRLQ